MTVRRRCRLSLFPKIIPNSSRKNAKGMSNKNVMISVSITFPAMRSAELSDAVVQKNWSRDPTKNNEARMAKIHKHAIEFLSLIKKFIIFSFIVFILLFVLTFNQTSQSSELRKCVCTLIFIGRIAMPFIISFEHLYSLPRYCVGDDN